jgi:hypothetical protein
MLGVQLLTEGKAFGVAYRDLRGRCSRKADSTNSAGEIKGDGPVNRVTQASSGAALSVHFARV